MPVNSGGVNRRDVPDNSGECVGSGANFVANFEHGEVSGVTCDVHSNASLGTHQAAFGVGPRCFVVYRQKRCRP